MIFRLIKKRDEPWFFIRGEKELLNIITATQLMKKVLMIDDSLSFLSEQNKIHSLSLLNNWVKENNGVIIWCTSDYNDLLFQCRSKWTLTSSSFKNNNKHDARYHNILLNPEGYLNLKIDNLSFGYENGKVIFNNLSININNARCLGLLGNNGSGKTTLAGLCFGDLKSLKGSIEKIGENSNLRIGYLDQFPENLLLLTKLVDFVEKLKS